MISAAQIGGKVAEKKRVASDAPVHFRKIVFVAGQKLSEV
jgi:hypothetical protein